MSFQPITTKEMTKELEKFHGKFPSGTVSGVELARRNNEFLNLKLNQAWEQGMLDAKKIVEDYPDTDTPVSDFTEAIMEAINKNTAPK